ncbi:MAG: MEDS domain-containing protein [Candidatus Nitrosocosmicus sp.]|nr:MEDS domain-containing protein [Candidatus Nitrosocosmicus sp.]
MTINVYKPKKSDDISHTFSIYSNSQEKLEAGLQFLIEGLENDESISFVTDDLSKEEIIERLKKICQFRFNISTLVNDGVITLLSSTQWYFSGNMLEKGKLSPSGGIPMCKSLSPIRNDTSMKNEDNIKGSDFILPMDSKKRFRAFYDMKPFFEKRYYEALINYESTQKGPSNPAHTLCAYEIGLMQEISPETFRTLVKNHTLINEMYYDALIDPSTNMHVILLYDKQEDLDKAVSTYINEGLKRGQLCIHASVSLANKSYLENFSSQITNYQENLEKGNLIVIDLVPYYVNAMEGNLESFNKLKEEMIFNTNQDPNRKDKHIRLTADCATLLFKNKHFEECINLENWWHEKPFDGSYVCPYPKSLLERYPFNAFLSRLIHNHDVIIDSNGKLIHEYML